MIDREARLVDLGDAGGTSIDGVRITETTLQDGVRFWLGAHTALKYLSADPRRLTTAEFLPQHRRQLEQTQALIAQADHNGQHRDNRHMIVQRKVARRPDGECPFEKIPQAGEHEPRPAQNAPDVLGAHRSAAGVPNIGSQARANQVIPCCEAT